MPLLSRINNSLDSIVALAPPTSICATSAKKTSRNMRVFRYHFSPRFHIPLSRYLSTPKEDEFLKRTTRRARVGNSPRQLQPCLGLPDHSAIISDEREEHIPTFRVVALTFGKTIRYPIVVALRSQVVYGQDLKRRCLAQQLAAKSKLRIPKRGIETLLRL